MSNIQQYKEVLFDTKSFDEVLLQVSESLGASADKAAMFDGPGPSARCALCRRTRHICCGMFASFCVPNDVTRAIERLIRPSPLFFVVVSGSDDPLSVMSKSLH